MKTMKPMKPRDRKGYGMKLRVGALVVAVALMAPAASALGGSSWPAGLGKHDGKFWKKDKERRELDLSDDVVRDLERIFTKNQQTLIDLEAEFKRKRAALDALFTEDQVEDKQFMTQVDLLERARADLAKARVLMLLEMRRVLSPTQREALGRLHDD
jgi:Spy/CpxP family protein refolding chaperone